MRTMITHLLAASLFFAPLRVAARDSFAPDSQAPKTQPIQGETYLANCPDILNLAPENYEKALVNSAQTEGQILQLLYEGGVVLSAPFFKAFVSSLDSQAGIQNITAQGFNNEKQKRKRYRAVANAIVRVSGWPQKKLNQFIWHMLEVEKTMAAVPTSAGTASAEVRYQQISNLINAISASANRPLIEKVLRDLVTQMLMQTAASILAETPPPGASSTRWHEVITAPVVIAITVAIISAGIVDNGNWTEHQQNVFGFWTLAAMLGIMTGPSIYVETKRFGGRLIARRFQSRIASLRNDKKIYIFPRSSGEERIEFSNLFAEFLQQDENLADPYHNTTISISHACATETCSLNPIQLAYLGAVDLLELEGLFKTLRDSIGSRVGAVNEIRDTATAVVQHPDNYKRAMDLRTAVSKFSASTGQLNKAELILLDRLSKKIEYLRADFAKLQEKPYIEDRTTPEAQGRGLLLMNRINTDLSKLENLQLNVDRFKTAIEISDNRVNLSREWLKSLPHSSTGWGEAAENILQQLNQAGHSP